jgi:adenylate cyclase
VVDNGAPGPAEFEAAGIYDPRASDAGEHLALLEYLSSLGASIDELAAAMPDEFGVLASDIALWGDRERLTIDEVAAASGVDKELISRTWRAAGLPEPDLDSDARTFTRPDIEVLAITSAGVEYLGDDMTIQLIRVLGSTAARVAEASVSAFMVNVAPQAYEQDQSGLELARANTNSIALLEGLTRGFDAFLRHHIERAFRPVGPTTATPGIDLVRRSIGFVDIVDSTAWTQQLELSALSQALSIFDSTASEIVVGRGGRVVKLIGDSVMFVSDDPAAAIEIALALVDAYATHELLPPVRAGVATGDVVARDGDYSGAVVNLAARAVTIARPSTLLVDPETVRALEGTDRFVCHSAGKFALKGFHERVTLSRVRRRDRPVMPN